MLLLSFIPKYLFNRAQRRRASGRLAAAHRDLSRAVQFGHAPAQYALARAYQIGEGCVRSGALAKHWYQIAAEKGHIDAQFELGLILLNGHDLGWMAGGLAGWLSHRAEQEKALVAALFPSGLESHRNPEAAFLWLHKAAEADKPEAQSNVGWLYLNGVGCKSDRAEALRWLSAAATHNISQAALGLAEYYGRKDAIDHNLDQSARWAKKASELGNASGSHQYGIALRDGAGVARDLLQAERQFALAVEQGHPTAAYDGAVLALARNISDSEVQAIIERIRHCAKRGHVPSAMLLADIYGRGDRVKPDPREVAHWYRSAADAGNAQAQFMIGCLFARGEGVELDLKHAARYFELAAKAGHPQAAFNLGLFRLNGQGGEPSVSDAKRWLEIAADRGIAQAELRLGQILEREAVTFSEKVSARAMIERAAKAGVGEAKVVLSRLLLADDKPDSEQRAVIILREAMNVGEVDACELLLRREPAGSNLDVVVQSLLQLARSGNSQAKFVLAEALLKGEKIPQNAETALGLLTEAAAAQEARAHFLLGVIHCQGVFVSKDVSRGYRHYLEAARLNHPIAQYNVGTMLIHGTGTDKNYEEALRWIRLAAINDVEKANEFIRSIQVTASPATVNA